MEQESDLRGGTTVWEARNGSGGHHGPVTENLKTDIVIVGAGITGSFIAEKLSAHGRSVVVVDRNRPQMASTAASTALLLWEIDTPLREVAMALGTEKAIEVYRASYAAVQGIGRLVSDLGLDCNYIARPSLYLAGTEMGTAELADEHRIRETAGFSGQLLGASEVGRDFGFTRPSALFYQGSAEVDPVALARGLMRTALSRGAKLFSPADVIGYDADSRGVTVTLDGGHVIGARTLILANGYDMPDFVPSHAHEVVSTWVVATAPAPALSWPGDAVVWEASDPYLYLRRTADARFIIGGEDEALTDAEVRDGKIPEKARAILAKQRDLWPRLEAPAEFAWAGFFGTTSDGLPLIGPISSHPNTYAAFGYGGNGITFSAIAADLIADALNGRSNSLFDAFAISR